MTKESITLILWILICYLLASFVFLSFNVFGWEWYGRLGLVIMWFWGVAYFENHLTIQILP